MAVNPSLSLSTNILECIPKQQLDYEHNYILTYTNKITNSDGKSLQPIDFNFITILHPTITAMNPSPNSVISLKPTFIISFNVSMNKDTLNSVKNTPGILYHDGDRQSVPLTCVANGEQEMVCSPNEILEPNKEYVFGLSNTILATTEAPLNVVLYHYITESINTNK